MEVTATLHERLRLMLNDKIPSGGSETDASFSNSEIDGLIQDSPNLYHAAAVGWTFKAAMLQSTIESYDIGQEQYDLTSLKDQYQHALAMSNQYSGLSQEEIVTKEKPRMYSRFMKVKRPRVY